MCTKWNEAEKSGLIVSTYIPESGILGAMAIEGIIAQLDAEIARLRQVRNLLSATGKVEAKLGGANGASPRKSRGAKAKAGVKRVLSPEARKAIADAQRRRWAAQKAKTKRDA
jgi:hypothetical protein